MSILPDDFGSTSSGGGAPPPGGVYFIGGVWYDAAYNPINEAKANAYNEQHFYGGPQGPGVYQTDQYGNPTVLIKPDSSGSSGGGNIGYQQLTDYDGSKTGTPGAIYQQGSNGAITVIYRPSSTDTAGQDPSGYDPKTGLPYGVVKVDKSISPTGLVYQGIPVNADGSPYTGGGGNGAPDAGMWTGYGPKGQGTYYLDGPNGTPGTYLGPTTQAGAGISSSGSGSAAGSTTRVLGTSSTGTSSTSAGDDIANLKAKNAANLEYQSALMALKQQYDTSGNLSADAQASLAQRDREFQAQFGLSLAQFEAQQQKDAAAQRSSNINDLRSAVNDVDPNAVRSLLFANAQDGNYTGNFLNRLKEGGTALSDQALLGATLLASELQGTAAGSAPGFQQLPGISTQTGGAIGGTGGTTGATGSTGGAPAAPAGPPTLQGNWKLMPGGVTDGPDGTQTQHYVWSEPGTGRRVAFQPGDINGPTDWAKSGAATMQGWGGQVWYQTPTGWINPITGETARDAEQVHQKTVGTSVANGPKTAGQNIMESIYTDQQGNQRWLADGSLVPMTINTPQMAQRINDLSAWYGTPNNTDTTLTAYSNGYDPYTPGGMPAGYATQAPAPAAANGAYIPGNLQNDQIQHEIPLTKQAVLPGLASGGQAMGTFVVGERGPEIVHAPQGASVAPISRQQMHGLLGTGMRGYAFGTQTFGSADTNLNSLGSYDANGTFQYNSPTEPAYASPTTTVGGRGSYRHDTSTPVQTSTPTTQTTMPTQTTIPYGNDTQLNTVPTTQPVQTQPVSQPPTAPPVTPVQNQPQPTPPAIPPATPVQGQPQPTTPTLESITGQLDLSGLTPEQGSLMQTIRDFREGAPSIIPNDQWLSLDVAAANPLLYQQALLNEQQRTGIPSQYLDWEIQNMRNKFMPGVSFSDVRTGY